MKHKNIQILKVPPRTSLLLGKCWSGEERGGGSRSRGCGSAALELDGIMLCLVNDVFATRKCREPTTTPRAKESACFPWRETAALQISCVCKYVLVSVSVFRVCSMSDHSVGFISVPTITHRGVRVALMLRCYFLYSIFIRLIWKPLSRNVL